ncbi:MAG: hypothetical protein J5671_03085 [Bacteroidaceae bacterium]|nr:hypothetical protein [Bacteroidaceae bacterium]
MLRLCGLMLLSVVLGLGMTACSDKDDVTDPKDQTVDPTAIIKPEDYVTVSSLGGTVTKDDVTVTFPVGTYTGDTRVAVSEVKEGDVLGDDEISNFYQLYLPTSTKEPTAVKIKCENADPDANVVAHIPAYYLSMDQPTYNDIVLESTYENGEYTVTLPPSGNVGIDKDEYVDISIGVAHREYSGTTAPVATKAARAQIFDEVFKEGNVSWHFEFSPFQKAAYADILFVRWDEINETIREAIKLLHGLGLAVTERNIAFSFETYYKYVTDPKTKKDKKVIDSETDGEFSQSSWSDESSTVSFNYLILENFEGRKTGFRSAAIHELMHVFQADYDPRWAYTKAKSLNQKYQITYESGAVWAEQLMTGEFSKGFVNGYIKEFVRGLDNATDIYSGSGKSSAQMYSAHGYAASTLLQYIFNNMSEYGFNNNSIKDLYEIWKKTGNYFKELVNELTAKKGYALFSYGRYDEFLLSLMKGDVVSAFSFPNFCPSPDAIIKDKKFAVTVKSEAYPFGCDVRMIAVDLPGTTELDGKELVLQHKKPGVKTSFYVYNEGYYDHHAYISEYSTDTISGKELKNFYNPTTKKYTVRFYAFTTTADNKKLMPYEISAELKDTVAVPQDLSEIEIDYFSFDAELKAKYTWTYDGADHPQDVGTSYFAFGSTLGYGQDPNTLKITSKMNGTTLHVEGKEEYDHESGGKYSKTFSFDIVNFTGDFKKAKLTNLVTKYSDYYTADEHSESELHLTDVGYKSFSPKNAYYKYNYLTLKSTVGTGLRVTSASASSCWQFSDGTPVSSKATFIPDDSDYAEFEISFRPKEK